jgi:hypothetical protein
MRFRNRSSSNWKERRKTFYFLSFQKSYWSRIEILNHEIKNDDTRLSFDEIVAIFRWWILHCHHRSFRVKNRRFRFESSKKDLKNSMNELCSFSRSCQKWQLFIDSTKIISMQMNCQDWFLSKTIKKIWKMFRKTTKTILY